MKDIISEAGSKPSQSYKMELFATTVDGFVPSALNYFPKKLSI